VPTTSDPLELVVKLESELLVILSSSLVKTGA